MKILPGVYPAFADAHPGGKPDLFLTALLSRRYGWGFNDLETRSRAQLGGLVTQPYAFAVYGFYDAVRENEPPGNDEPLSGPHPQPLSQRERGVIIERPQHVLRDWFPDAGVLICRPAPKAKHALGAALKGGHNAENHNHNDVGSFVVALGRSTPLLDPGSEIYTARTFNQHRYESKVINSFGHSVPRVAGQLQSTGRQAAAKVLKTDFTDQTDTLVLDLTAAYKVKELKRLVRTFVFSREGAGMLKVIDQVEFDSPQSFDTALITFDQWKQLAPNRLLVGNKPDEVVVEIAVSGREFRVSAEKIDEQLPGGHKPTRIGIALIQPVDRATITMTIKPAP